MRADTETPEGARAAPIQGGERRQVTAMFADVVGSTPLAEKIGEEALYRVMGDVIGEMSGAVQRHGGTIEKLTGDGLMALFGAPLAVEDAPVRACAAGLEILTRIAALGDRLMASEGERPHVRIGVNTGYAVVGSLGAGLQQEVTALGDSVNLAARLEGLAEIDGMVIGESTYKLVGEFMETEFAGEQAVKGKAEKQKVWHVRGAKPGMSRFEASVRRGLSKLVGREAELGTMQDAFRISQTEKMRIVNVCGDAGIGKSRLVHEFRQRLPDEGVFWLQGNCTAQGKNAPFLPFIEVVRSSFGMTDDDPASLVERRLRRGVDVLGMDPDATLPYLLNLLGHQVEGSAFTKEHAEVAGIRTREILHRLLIERCGVSNVVLHIDDLHWIDQASQSLLVRLIEEEPGVSLLLLFTYRPEYTPPWAEVDAQSTLYLRPLSVNATEEMLRSRLGVQDLPQALTRMILEKAEGNPLFAEEIINYLEDRDSLEHFSADDMVALPVSLENLLMARVDRLDEATKSLLQAASVIGRTFLSEVVGEVAQLDGQLESSIQELQRLGLIQVDGQSGAYRFKNALIRDAIYSSLLTERRELLHERTAQALEDRHAERIGEVTESLAHHYSQTSRADKAVRYMAEAGAQSLRVYSLDEADLRLSQVVELVEAVPGCADDGFLVDVLLQLARVKYFRADMHGLIRLLQPHLARAEALGDSRRLANFLFEIGYAQVFSGDHANGMALLERSRTIAKDIGDELILGRIAMGEIWYYLTYVDLLPEARRRIDELEAIALKAGRAAGDIWLISKTYCAMSIYSGSAGNPKLARDYARRLFELTRETNDPRARNMGLWTLSINDSLTFSHEEAIENGREGMRSALCQIDGLLAQAALGAALGLSGRTDEALPLLQSYHDVFLERGLVVALASTDLFLGPTKVLNGKLSEGVRFAEECRARNVAWGTPNALAMADLVLGEIYTEIACGEEKPPLPIMLKNFWFLVRTLPRVNKLARQYLGRALEYFRHINAPSSIAWALYDLARIDLKQRHNDAARDKLTEAHRAARSVEADVLADRIEHALQKLGAVG